MQLSAVVLILSASLALAASQRFAGPNPNAFDDYDYDDGGARGAPVRHSPQPRSYAPNQPRLSAALPKPTPVPILKQINRHNDDGSYTYGYEGADGSFKIETKLVTGEVMGKYGYVDDSGKVRVVEYGANRYGFQPSGEGITVAPPTLVDETQTPKPGRKSPLSALAAGPQESQEDIYDDGQYYEEPSTAAPQRVAPIPTRLFRPQAAPQPQRPRFQQPQYFENSFTAPAAANRPSHIPNNFAQFTQSTNFAPQPSYSAPSRPVSSPSFSSSAFGPVPARAQISGAVPVGAPLRPLSPAPVREPQSSAAASPAPQALFVPQSQLHTQPARRPSPGGGGLLDQLARDYALPQNAAQPLVDTSFGLY